MQRSLQTLLLLVGVVLILKPQTAQAQSCDDVRVHIEETNKLIRQLPPYPGNETAAKLILHEARESQPGLAAKIIAIIEEDAYLQDHDAVWARCFVDNTGLMDMNILAWRQFLSGTLVAPQFRSAEFVRGAGLHIDINQGVADLGQNTEAFSFSARTLFAYTCVKKSIRSGAGGKVRLLGGPSVYYYNTEWTFMGNVRMEYRLNDIAGKQFSIGNIKLIADANSDLDVWIVGGGLGVEVYNFGVQLLYHRQNEVKHSQTQIGLFYRLPFSKR